MEDVKVLQCLNTELTNLLIPTAHQIKSTQSEEIESQSPLENTIFLT